jgi:hypothetical protein
VRTATWLLAVCCADAVATAQDQEVRGRVLDDRGQPVAGAEVTFVPLPVDARPRTRSKGRYQLAQAAHRAATKLPRTRTDRDGVFLCMVSPQLAALGAGSGVEIALRVSAPGHLLWMRAIGERIEGAQGLVTTLPRATPGGAPRLRVRVATGIDGVYRGYALIERAYRARPDRSVWLRHLAPISGTGEVNYDEPCRVPGEVSASLPTARAEGYRVTLFVAGLDRWQRTLTEGEHEVRPERSDFAPRRVLAERGAPAPAPITATWVIAGEEVTLSLAEPLVPLLGGEVPVRVTSPSGPVAIDAWDPDVPLFIDKEGQGHGKEVMSEAAPKPAEATRTGEVVISDRRKQPLFGAAVWVEDMAARVMLPSGKPFAVSDPLGVAKLSGLPPGLHRILVRHASAGEREVLFDTAVPGPLQVVLQAPPPVNAPSAQEQHGALLLECACDPDAEGELDIGVMQPGSRMLRRSFADKPARVRLEGLTPGPATVWARVGAGPVHVLGGVLAMATEEPALHPFRAARKTFTLDVRTHEGQPAPEVHMSLGENSPKGRKALTAELLPLQRDAASGRLILELRLLGDVWVVVHGAQGERRDLLLQSEGGAELLEVRLPKPPPVPEEKVEGEGKKDGGDK